MNKEQNIFPSYAHHICLVSAQTLPNILPILQHKPLQTKNLHLIVSTSMKDKAELLTQVFEKHGCKVFKYPLKDMEASTLYVALNAAHSAAHQAKNTSIALNMTGGTKIMALLAANWAYSENIPTFYVDTTEEYILSLHTQRHVTYPLLDVLDMETILAAQGFNIQERITSFIPQAERKLLEEFLRLAVKPSAKLTILNACATYATHNNILYAHLNMAPTGVFLQLLNLCQDHDLLTLAGKTITFTSADTRRFCNGFWLEDYVRGVLYKLHADKYIQSWGCGVEVFSDAVKNEFDAIFSARNRLFVVECKTSQMGDTGKKGTEHIFKLDTLGDKVGGLKVHKMLVSVNPLSATDAKRAQEYDIALITGNDILQLSDKLKGWVKNVY